MFMKTGETGSRPYLSRLEKIARPGVSGAIVMNANPFTRATYLVETAAARAIRCTLFLLSEDASLVPFGVRKQLVQAGTAHLKNVVLHDSGPYIISNATFPSYFLKDDAAVIQGHAKLDLAIFVRIARALGVTVRFVGEEPTSQVTGLYNEIMAAQLPENGIDCVILPRKQALGKAISASTVRRRFTGRGLADPFPAGAPNDLRLFQVFRGRACAAAYPQCGECGPLLRKCL